MSVVLCKCVCVKLQTRTLYFDCVVLHNEIQKLERYLKIFMIFIFHHENRMFYIRKYIISYISTKLLKKKKNGDKCYCANNATFDCFRLGQFRSIWKRHITRLPASYYYNFFLLYCEYYFIKSLPK